MAHLYGPAARCKPKMMIWRKLVLRFCIRPIDGAFELLAIMDIRARSISFASRPRRPSDAGERREGRRSEAVPAQPGAGLFEALPPCLVGMEACATAHYWARELA